MAANGLVLREQRILTRRDLIYYLKITDRKTGEELGRVGDIHTEGMLVLSSAPLPLGLFYKTAVALPKSLADSVRLKELPLCCETLWSRPGPKNANFYETGVRFVAADKPQRIIIEKIIASFAISGAEAP
ncbi:MAG: hypothetical protein LBS31_06330 [Candidatus Adiutrix sp.]|jgi:hypothetical protein|nr:hypothetical protein [Candidatus Adiutrix sp.]